MDQDIALRQIVDKHGVFLRREAEALGYHDATIQRRIRRGAWVRVRHGTYTFPDVWDAADAIGQFRLHGRGVLRRHASEIVLTHTSSIAQQDLPLFRPNLEASHVTRLDGSMGRNTRDVRYHQGALREGDVTIVNDVPVTAAPRAVVEYIALEDVPVESGLVVADAALRRKLATTETLTLAHDHMRQWAGSLKADLVLRLADGRSESVGESRARYLMWSNAVPMPELQYKVYDDRGILIGIADFAWPQLGVLGEFDGQEKYERYRRPGETPGDAVFREKRREDRMRAATGWRFIRLVWADLYRPVETANCIHQALAWRAA